MPTEPDHLDFPNAQILLIGESSGVDKAVEPQEKDKKEPEDVLEELEEEDLERMKHLGGDDSAAIFKDLEAKAKDYPKLQTTF
jgi:6-phosphofructokinase